MTLRISTFVLAACLLAAAVPAFAAGPGPAYKPGPSDTLMISVWNDKELTHEVLIRPDGKFSFPLVGEVRAEGRTVEQIRRVVQSRLKAFVPDEPVSVMVTKVDNPKVFVVGKVLRPGAFSLSAPLTVAQALALAGGFTPFAATGDIVILRKTGGGQRALPFDYDAVAKGRHLEENIDLLRGDTIVVP